MHGEVSNERDIYFFFWFVFKEHLVIGLLEDKQSMVLYITCTYAFRCNDFTSFIICKEIYAICTGSAVLPKKFDIEGCLWFFWIQFDNSCLYLMNSIRFFWKVSSTWHLDPNCNCFSYQEFHQGFHWGIRIQVNMFDILLQFMAYARQS